jgi:DNA-binding transcriptional regulator YdaS (Cro superfamily)
MSNFHKHLQALLKDAGSQHALAASLGLTQQGVSYLMTDAKNISPKLAIKVEKLTGGKVSRADLRPDLWGAA